MNIVGNDRTVPLCSRLVLVSPFVDYDKHRESAGEALKRNGFSGGRQS